MVLESSASGRLVSDGLIRSPRTFSMPCTSAKSGLFQGLWHVSFYTILNYYNDPLEAVRAIFTVLYVIDGILLNSRHYEINLSLDHSLIRLLVFHCQAEEASKATGQLADSKCGLSQGCCLSILSPRLSSNVIYYR